MKLSHLLKAIDPIRINGHAVGADDTRQIVSHIGIDPEIKSLHSRAQNVKAGGLFVAIKGFTLDGHDFIDTAVQNGAVAVITQHGPSQNTSVPVIDVADSRAALASLAVTFYDHPSQKMVLIGITGTNGKTTTSYLIEKILQAAGLAVGVIGTINYRYDGKVFNNPVTTPESLDLQRILHAMQTGGVTHVVLEVSSHALDLHRVDHCRFDVGVFTNFTQDHLDYHKTMAAYWACKKRLFAEILPTGPKSAHATAVINCNNSKGEELLQLKSLSHISVGDAPTSDVWPEIYTQNLSGITGRVHTPRGVFDFFSPLAGMHNRENILCAVGVGEALRVPLESIRAGVEGVHAIPGRLEPVPNDSNRFVYIDYAHTPDALKNVLTSLRAISDSRLVCVFGCGGDRDKSKRPLMGEIAGTLSDLAILTSDNPRSENPLDIIEQIVPGVRKVVSRRYQPAAVLNGYKEKGFVVEPDRRAALRLGIAAAGPREIVLIAGKGHENYQILADRTIHFDDREEALIALSDAGVSTAAGTNPNPAQNNANAGLRPPMDWCVDDCLRAAGGELLGGSQAARFGGICIDSRQISPSDLFVAIKGEVHDGHRFAAEVVQKGVRGLVVGRERLPEIPWQDWVQKGIVCISVADTTRALGDLAAYHRRRNRVSVAAITGSNGKTTTRQMTAAVVSRRYRTLSTRKNFNNDIGLPLTLFELSPDHRWAVVELGMNAPGEIRRLAEICDPNIGVITNIGPAHLAGVGSIEGVMDAKGELLEKLAPEATAVLNADDKRVATLAARTEARIVTYGFTEKALVQATDVSETARGSRFTLQLPHAHIPIDLKIPGRFMIANALAAAAVGHIIALAVEEIKAGLENFEPIGGRMNIVDMSNGIHLIDDTYNANPGSMQAALSTLQALCSGHRSIFVAGDMKELGTHSQALHREVGALAARSGVARIFAVGEFAEALASAAVAEGIPPDNVMTGSKQDILNALREFLQAGDWVLVKGSRGMTMEEIVQGLKQWAANSD